MLEEFELLGVALELIFGVPLHGENEALTGVLEGFDGAVVRIAGSDTEPGADFVCGLVVARVDAPAGDAAGNLSEHACGLDFDFMYSRAFVLRLRRMTPWRKMLN